MIHLLYIAAHEWEVLYQDGRPLKEPAMDGMFFQAFATNRGGTTAVLTYALARLPLATTYRRLYRSDQSWPLNVIAECTDIQPVNEQLRQYRPRSDLLIIKSNFPRLLVEVNSTPKTQRSLLPEDLIRILVLGAAIVRFANKFLDGFKTNRNFVLFAIYI